MGHSQENADELMATVADITLNDPEGVKELLRSLGEADRQTVRAAIAATYTIIGAKHENLQPTLDEWEKQFAGE